MISSTEKACKKCNFITVGDTCPICGSQTSKEWQGYLVVLDYSRSAVAKKMNIEHNGKYALRVR
ncbi:MAG: DNA-directed RNA polymerase, subunit E'' [archaeon]|nr:DNA-directed RNA polymerase, subunit E'' [archaeon]